MANPHEEGRPIVVKRIKKGGHSAHGGSWKVAFADFAVAMMAFFLVMYLVESATPKEKIIIAGYFADPIGFYEGGQPTVIDLGGSSSQVQKHGQEGMDDKTIPSPDESVKLGKGDKEQVGDKNGGKSGKETETGNAVEKAMEQKKYNAKLAEKTEQTEKERVEKATKVAEQVAKAAEFKKFVELEQNIKKMIDQNPALNKFKDQILLEISAQGLQIQIMDKEKRPMYESGSDNMNPFAKDILTELGKVISQVPNRISITGHTDAVPYGGGLVGYSNWELSADRANGARRALVKGGVKDEQLAQVVGLSSSALFDTANPKNPINRRISILVLSADSEAELSKRQKYERDLDVDQSTEINSEKIAPPSAKELPEWGGSAADVSKKTESDSKKPVVPMVEQHTIAPENAPAVNEKDLYEEEKDPLMQPYLGADHVSDIKLKKPKVNPDDLPLPSFVPRVAPISEGESDEAPAVEGASTAPNNGGSAHTPNDEPPLPSFVPKIGDESGVIQPSIQPAESQSKVSSEAPKTVEELAKPLPVPNPVNPSVKPLPLEMELPVKPELKAPEVKTPAKPATKAPAGAAPKNNAFWDEEPVKK